MQKSLRLAGLAALIGLLIWGWWVFFPGPERLIRKRLQELATVASFSNEGAVAKAYNAKKVTTYFTEDISITAEIPGRGTQTLQGIDTLQQVAMGARQNWSGMTVEFLDIHVTLGADKTTATANLTGKLTLAGERDFSVQEFNFTLKKVGGTWLIERVEMVKTLSQRTRSDGVLRCWSVGYRLLALGYSTHHSTTPSLHQPTPS